MWFGSSWLYYDIGGFCLEPTKCQVGSAELIRFSSFIDQQSFKRRIMLIKSFEWYNRNKVECQWDYLGIIETQLGQNLRGLVTRGLHFCFIGPRGWRPPPRVTWLPLPPSSASVWLSALPWSPSGLGDKEQMGIAHTGWTRLAYQTWPQSRNRARAWSAAPFEGCPRRFSLVQARWPVASNRRKPNK